MASLTLRRLSKQFAEADAVRSISLEVHSGEFFSILGPSGCGKTTLLRLVAGFESPSGGSILLDGNDITDVPAQHRGIAMVFQNYALFPHMTVFQNVAFGLETHHVPAAEIRKRVGEALDAVHLAEKAQVKVPKLSGGEQQRVAVARALVVRPALLLFDEPLSNLDVALRLTTREEIRSLQRATGITTLYVTHDQAEAMSLSHRIAVMRSGAIEQVGTPEEAYESPASAFVARFLGAANILRGHIRGGVFRSGKIAARIHARQAASGNGAALIAIRPEAIELNVRRAGGSRAGVVREREYLGFTTSFTVEFQGAVLRVSAPSSPSTRAMVAGTRVGVSIDWSRCSVITEDE